MFMCNCEMSDASSKASSDSIIHHDIITIHYLPSTNLSKTVILSDSGLPDELIHALQTSPVIVREHRLRDGNINNEKELDVFRPNKCMDTRLKASEKKICEAKDMVSSKDFKQKLESSSEESTNGEMEDGEIHGNRNVLHPELVLIREYVFVAKNSGTELPVHSATGLKKLLRLEPENITCKPNDMFGKIGDNSHKDEKLTSAEAFYTPDVIVDAKKLTILSVLEGRSLSKELSTLHDGIPNSKCNIQQQQNVVDKVLTKNGGDIIKLHAVDKHLNENTLTADMSKKCTLQKHQCINTDENNKSDKDYLDKCSSKCVEINIGAMCIEESIKQVANVDNSTEFISHIETNAEQGKEIEHTKKNNTDLISNYVKKPVSAISFCVTYRKPVDENLKRWDAVCHQSEPKEIFAIDEKMNSFKNNASRLNGNAVLSDHNSLIIYKKSDSDVIEEINQGQKIIEIPLLKKSPISTVDKKLLKSQNKLSTDELHLKEPKILQSSSLNCSDVSVHNACKPFVTSFPPPPPLPPRQTFHTLMSKSKIQLNKMTNKPSVNSTDNQTCKNSCDCRSEHVAPAIDRNVSQSNHCVNSNTANIGSRKKIVSDDLRKMSNVDEAENPIHCPNNNEKLTAGTSNNNNASTIPEHDDVRLPLTPRHARKLIKEEKRVAADAKKRHSRLVTPSCDATENSTSRKNALQWIKEKIARRNKWPETAKQFGSKLIEHSVKRKNASKLPVHVSKSVKSYDKPIEKVQEKTASKSKSASILPLASGNEDKRNSAESISDDEKSQEPNKNFDAFTGKEFDKDALEHLERCCTFSDCCDESDVTSLLPFPTTNCHDRSVQMTSAVESTPPHQWNGQKNFSGKNGNEIEIRKHVGDCERCDFSETCKLKNSYVVHSYKHASDESSTLSCDMKPLYVSSEKSLDSISEDEGNDVPTTVRSSDEKCLHTERGETTHDFQCTRNKVMHELETLFDVKSSKYNAIGPTEHLLTRKMNSEHMRNQAVKSSAQQCNVKPFEKQSKLGIHRKKFQVFTLFSKGKKSTNSEEKKNVAFDANKEIKFESLSCMIINDDGTKSINAKAMEEGLQDKVKDGEPMKTFVDSYCRTQSDCLDKIDLSELDDNNYDIDLETDSGTSKLLSETNQNWPSRKSKINIGHYNDSQRSVEEHILSQCKIFDERPQAMPKEKFSYDRGCLNTLSNLLQSASGFELLKGITDSSSNYSRHTEEQSEKLDNAKDVRERNIEYNEPLTCQTGLSELNADNNKSFALVDMMNTDHIELNSCSDIQVLEESELSLQHTEKPTWTLESSKRSGDFEEHCIKFDKSSGKMIILQDDSDVNSSGCKVPQYASKHFVEDIVESRTSESMNITKNTNLPPEIHLLHQTNVGNTKSIYDIITQVKELDENPHFARRNSLLGGQTASVKESGETISSRPELRKLTCVTIDENENTYYQTFTSHHQTTLTVSENLAPNMCATPVENETVINSKCGLNDSNDVIRRRASSTSAIFCSRESFAQRPIPLRKPSLADEGVIGGTVYSTKSKILPCMISTGDQSNLQSISTTNSSFDIDIPTDRQMMLDNTYQRQVGNNVGSRDEVEAGYVGNNNSTLLLKKGYLKENNSISVDTGIKNLNSNGASSAVVCFEVFEENNPRGLRSSRPRHRLSRQEPIAATKYGNQSDDADRSYFNLPRRLSSTTNRGEVIDDDTNNDENKTKYNLLDVEIGLSSSPEKQQLPQFEPLSHFVDYLSPSSPPAKRNSSTAQHYDRDSNGIVYHEQLLLNKIDHNFIKADSGMVNATQFFYDFPSEYTPPMETATDKTNEIDELEPRDDYLTSSDTDTYVYDRIQHDDTDNTHSSTCQITPVILRKKERDKAIDTVNNMADFASYDDVDKMYDVPPNRKVTFPVESRHSIMSHLAQTISNVSRNDDEVFYSDDSMSSYVTQFAVIRTSEDIDIIDMKHVSGTNIYHETVSTRTLSDQFSSDFNIDQQNTNTKPKKAHELTSKYPIEDNHDELLSSSKTSEHTSFAHSISTGSSSKYAIFPLCSEHCRTTNDCSIADWCEDPYIEQLCTKKHQEEKDSLNNNENVPEIDMRKPTSSNQHQNLRHITCIDKRIIEETNGSHYVNTSKLETNVAEENEVFWYIDDTLRKASYYPDTDMLKLPSNLESRNNIDVKDAYSDEKCSKTNFTGKVVRKNEKTFPMNCSSEDDRIGNTENIFISNSDRSADKRQIVTLKCEFSDGDMKHTTVKDAEQLALPQLRRVSSFNKTNKMLCRLLSYEDQRVSQALLKQDAKDLSRLNLTEGNDHVTLSNTTKKVKSKKENRIIWRKQNKGYDFSPKESCGIVGKRILKFNELSSSEFESPSCRNSDEKYEVITGQACTAKHEKTRNVDVDEKNVNDTHSSVHDVTMTDSGQRIQSCTPSDGYAEIAFAPQTVEDQSHSQIGIQNVCGDEIIKRIMNETCYASVMKNSNQYLNKHNCISCDEKINSLSSFTNFEQSSKQHTTQDLTPCVVNDDTSTKNIGDLSNMLCDKYRHKDQPLWKTPSFYQVRQPQEMQQQRKMQLYLADRPDPEIWPHQDVQANWEVQPQIEAENYPEVQPQREVKYDPKVQYYPEVQQHQEEQHCSETHLCQKPLSTNDERPGLNIVRSESSLPSSEFSKSNRLRANETNNKYNISSLKYLRKQFLKSKNIIERRNSSIVTFLSESQTKHEKSALFPTKSLTYASLLHQKIPLKNKDKNIECPAVQCNCLSEAIEKKTDISYEKIAHILQNTAKEKHQILQTNFSDEPPLESFVNLISLDEKCADVISEDSKDEISLETTNLFNETDEYTEYDDEDYDNYVDDDEKDGDSEYLATPPLPERRCGRKLGKYNEYSNVFRVDSQKLKEARMRSQSRTINNSVDKLKVDRKLRKALKKETKRIASRSKSQGRKTAREKNESSTPAKQSRRKRGYPRKSSNKSSFMPFFHLFELKRKKEAITDATKHSSDPDLMIDLENVYELVAGVSSSVNKSTTESVVKTAFSKTNNCKLGTAQPETTPVLHEPIKSVDSSHSDVRPIGRLITVNSDGSKLLELYRPTNGQLGIQLTQSSEEVKKGKYVSGFVDKSREKLFSGILKIGDCVIEINDESVEDCDVDKVHKIIDKQRCLKLRVFPAQCCF